MFATTLPKVLVVSPKAALLVMGYVYIPQHKTVRVMEEFSTEVFLAKLQTASVKKPMILPVILLDVLRIVLQPKTLPAKKVVVVVVPLSSPLM
tara:strand:- start:584 stop:862 length:279 start_codon:yes stop_codon:yes gene_type:complete